MSPKKRGAELDKYSCEYIVYGDFERHAPYSFNTTAYWVTLSKMVEDVKKKKQGLRFNVDLVLRRSVLTLKLWKC